MFTQPCFIRKDMPQLRTKLKDIGQRENTFDDFSGEWLAANHGMFISVCEGFQNLCKEDIDCGTNEKLFLALAALRDDTDYMQYFVCADEFVLCDRNDWVDMYSVLHSGGKYSIEQLDNARKATVEELIEHFK